MTTLTQQKARAVLEQFGPVIQELAVPATMELRLIGRPGIAFRALEALAPLPQLLSNLFDHLATEYGLVELVAPEVIDADLARIIGQITESLDNYNESKRKAEQ